MSCAGTPGCCERHPKLSGCISRSSAARGSGSSTPQDPGTAAKTASALDHLGASLLGLPNAVERYARFRVEAPRATNVPIPDVVSLGSRVNYSDFLSAHPPLTLTTGQRKARRLALCLWGIPGTMQGMSRELELDATSVFQSAHSVIHQVLMPAETAGWTTAAFAHSWLPPSMKAAQQELLKRSIREAYGSRLKGSRHEALGGLTAERITSFALSIVASLELARAHAVAEGSAFDLVCAARYDWFVHRTLDLSLVDPTALTTATWCTHSAHAGSYGRGQVESFGTPTLAHLQPSLSPPHRHRPAPTLPDTHTRRHLGRPGNWRTRTAAGSCGSSTRPSASLTTSIWAARRSSSGSLAHCCSTG